MRTFEVGKRYSDGALTFEIIGRTDKTIKFVEIMHAGRFNERKSEAKKTKIHNWVTGEVFYVRERTIEA